MSQQQPQNYWVVYVISLTLISSKFRVGQKKINKVSKEKPDYNTPYLHTTPVKVLYAQVLFGKPRNHVKSKSVAKCF